MRIYTFTSAETEQARKTLVRHAAREFQILEGIDHPGILKVRDYKETELGPALIFDHDPQAIRLDFLLREQGKNLNVDQRLHIVRQLAETLGTPIRKSSTTEGFVRRASSSGILVRHRPCCR